MWKWELAQLRLGQEMEWLLGEQQAGELQASVLPVWVQALPLQEVPGCQMEALIEAHQGHHFHSWEGVHLTVEDSHCKVEQGNLWVVHLEGVCKPPFAAANTGTVQGVWVVRLEEIVGVDKKGAFPGQLLEAGQNSGVL